MSGIHRSDYEVKKQVNVNYEKKNGSLFQEYREGTMEDENTEL